LGYAVSGRGARAGSSGSTYQPPDGRPHFPPKAKSVIWIFLCGGVSHLESFDVKPELNKYAGKSIEETPYKDVLDPAKVQKDIVGGNPAHGNRKVIMPLQTGYKEYRKSGLVVGDWFHQIGECADDLAVIRSLWTLDNDHGAQLDLQTGRHVREARIRRWFLGYLWLGLAKKTCLSSSPHAFPPAIVVVGPGRTGQPISGPETRWCRLNVDPKKPLAFIRPAGASVTLEDQVENLSLLGKLNHLAGIDYPDDKSLRARIKSYELAFQMQTSIPETLQLEKESDQTLNLYGLSRGAEGSSFAHQCLAARRLVERGVRFVQVFHGGGGGGDWDAHSEIKLNHSKLAAQVDRPVAGLLKDLKQRGMLEETLVVFGTEFGRSPGAEGTGRDHHPQGFCAWLAGGRAGCPWRHRRIRLPRSKTGIMLNFHATVFTSSLDSHQLSPGRGAWKSITRPTLGHRELIVRSGAHYAPSIS
jgi:hypothetical protein